MNSEGVVYDPSQRDAWTPEKHKKFYEALDQYVNALLRVDAKSDGLASPELDYRGITIEGVVFPPQKAGRVPDYNEVFREVRRITFSGCEFYNENIEVGYPINFLYFKSCVFNEIWNPDFNIGYSQEDALFQECIFKHGVILSSKIPDRFRVIFSDCEIGSLFLENYCNESALIDGTRRGSMKTLSVRNSKISRPLNLSGFCLGEVDFTDCTFESKVDLSDCSIQRLKVVSSEFKGICDLSNTAVKSFCNSSVDYADFALFENCLLGEAAQGLEEESVDFSQVTFHKAANFRDARFCQKLDLRNSVFLQTPTFLGSTFEKKAERQTDRETFRIIKQAFVAVNNQIEADRFYAYEMQSYHNELRDVVGGQYRERALLGFNNIISSHGQNYLRASGWLILCTLVISLVLANDIHQWVSTSFPGPNWWQLIRNALNGFAQGFLPLRGLYAGREHLAFFIMSATFVLSAISWHLLGAIRRYRRR